MNFLAHAYLSFDHQPFIIGNMISDFVKGKQKFQYSDAIQSGIELHRKIDTFTDEHPLIAEAKKVFKPKVGLYAGAFVDVAMDYFIANDPNIKTPEQWEKFSENIYKVLSNHTAILPQRFLRMLPYMVKEDWLYNYRYVWGIENSMRNVVRRAAFLPDDTDVMPEFENNTALLQDIYNKFFPRLYGFVLDNIRILTKE